jgi:methionyl-tRNA formyltransferase
LGGEAVRVWRADVAARGMEDGDAMPGTILALGGAGILVACGEGTLRLLELQPAGGRRMSAVSFAVGRRLAPGARFDVATEGPTADKTDGEARGANR